MKRADFVDNILTATKTYEWGLEKLDNKCDRLVCGGHCNGKNCDTCPITEGKKRLAEKFGIKLQKEVAPVTINITVKDNAKAVFRFDGNTFRWI